MVSNLLVVLCSEQAHPAGHQRRDAAPLRRDAWPSARRSCSGFPPELYAALEKWAADELRSVNGQIEYLLAQAGPPRRPRSVNKRG